MLTQSIPVVHVEDVKNQQKNQNQLSDEFGFGEVVGYLMQPSALKPNTMELIYLVQWEHKQNPPVHPHKPTDLVNLTQFDHVASRHKLNSSENIEIFYDEEGNLTDEKGNFYHLDEEEEPGDSLEDEALESSQTKDSDFMNESTEVTGEDANSVDFEEKNEVLGEGQAEVHNLNPENGSEEVETTDTVN